MDEYAKLRVLIQIQEITVVRYQALRVDTI
jgi:hypothetical protein